MGVYGRPVPERVDSVLLDGEPVRFENQDTVERVFGAAHELGKLKRHRAPADSFGFVALYGGYVDIKNVPRRFDRWLDISVNEDPISPSDIDDGDTVAIGAHYHDMKSPMIRHALVAAETSEDMMFFHILGSDGPFALSGLKEALDTYKSSNVYNFEEIKLLD